MTRLPLSFLKYRIIPTSYVQNLRDNSLTLSLHYGRTLQFQLAMQCGHFLTCPQQKLTFSLCVPANARRFLSFLSLVALLVNLRSYNFHHTSEIELTHISWVRLQKLKFALNMFQQIPPLLLTTLCKFYKNYTIKDMGMKILMPVVMRYANAHNYFDARGYEICKCTL